MRRIGPWILGFAGLVLPATARGEPAATDPDGALYEEAVAAADKGDGAACVTKGSAAWERSKSAAIAATLGFCAAELGDDGLAGPKLEYALKLDDDPSRQKRSQDALGEVMARAAIVEVAARPTGCTVKIDGTEVTDPVGGTYVKPGHVPIDVSKAGYVTK